MVQPITYLKAVLGFNKASFKAGNKPIDTQSINPKLALGLKVPSLNQILDNNSPEIRKELYLQIPANADLRQARLNVLAEESKDLTAFEILQKQFGGNYDFNNFISFLPEGFRAKYTNEKAFEALAEELSKGDNSVFAPNNEREAIFALPTGTGKTGIFALIASLMRKDQKVMITVPSLVLNDQIAGVFRKLYPHKTISFISSSNLEQKSTGEIQNNFSGDIIIIVEDSLLGWKERMKEENVSIKPALIICDEFHLYENANGFQTAFTEFIEYCKQDDQNRKSEKPIILKFSATPYPAKIKKQKDTDIPVVVGNTVHWLDPNKVPSGKIICQVSPAEAIKEGELCNVKWKSVKMDLDAKLIESLDKQITGNEETLGKKIQSSWQNIVRKYIDFYQTDTEQHNKKILAVCPFIKNAKYAAEEFCKQTGRVSAVVSSGTNCIFTANKDGTVIKQNFTREEILEKYRNKEIEAIFNVRVLREGVDFPDIEAIWMMTPTNAVDNYLQFIGRGMRLDPNNPDKVLQIIDLVPETYSLISPLTAPRVFGFPNPEEGELLFAEKTNNEESENFTIKNNLVTIDHSGFYDSFLSLLRISAEIRYTLKKEKLTMPDIKELFQLVLVEADKMHEEQDWKFIICPNNPNNPISIPKSLISLHEEKSDIIHDLRFNYKIFLSVKESLINNLKAAKVKKQEELIINNNTQVPTKSLLTELTKPIQQRKEEAETEPKSPSFGKVKIKPEVNFREDDDNDRKGETSTQVALRRNTQLYYLQQNTNWKDFVNEFIQQIKSKKILDIKLIDENKEALEYYLYCKLTPPEQKSLLTGKRLNNKTAIIEVTIQSLEDRSIIRVIQHHKNNSSVYLPGNEIARVSSKKFFAEILANPRLKQVFDSLVELCKDYNIPDWVILESFIGNQYNRIKLNYILKNNTEGESNYINCLPIFALANLIEYAKKEPSLQEYLYLKQKELINTNVNNTILWTTQNTDIFHLKILLNSTLFEEIIEENSTSNSKRELSEIKQDFIKRISSFPNYRQNILNYLRTNKIEDLKTEIKEFLIEVVNINSNLENIKTELKEYLENFWTQWNISSQQEKNSIIHKLLPEENKVFDKSTALQKLSNLYFSKILDNFIQSNNTTILSEMKKRLANLPYNLTISDERKELILNQIKTNLLGIVDLNNKIYQQIIDNNPDFKSIKEQIQEILLNEIKNLAKYIKLSSLEIEKISKKLLPEIINTLKNNSTVLLNESSIKTRLTQRLKQENLEFNLSTYIQELSDEILRNSQVYTDSLSQLPEREQQYFLNTIEISSNKSTQLIGSLNDEQKAELNSLIRQHYSQTDNNFVSTKLFMYLLEQELNAKRTINFSEIERIIPADCNKTESVYEVNKNTQKLVLFIDKTKLQKIIKLLKTTETTFTRNAAITQIKTELTQNNHTISDNVIETILNQVLSKSNIKVITQEIINRAILFINDYIAKKK